MQGAAQRSSFGKRKEKQKERPQGRSCMPSAALPQAKAGAVHQAALASALLAVCRFAAAAGCSARALKRRRIGASTSLAETPEMMLMMAAARITRFQPPPTDSTDASGTSSEAVPKTMYSVPELPAAYLLPKVSAQVAGGGGGGAPRSGKISAAKVMKAYGLWPNIIMP